MRTHSTSIEIYPKLSERLLYAVRQAAGDPQFSKEKSSSTTTFINSNQYSTRNVYVIICSMMH